MTGPKIITLDIETSPIVAYVWSLWKQNVGLNQIVRDWTVLSFSAKTLGDRTIRYMDVAGQVDLYDDGAVMSELWKELDSADVIVAQNGIRFDVRKINARFLTLGFAPPTPYKVVDTMVEAKKVAMFTSNKLEWLSAVLTDTPKSKHKSFPGFELWTECLADNPKAWAEMRKYNVQDVKATEALYLKLRPYIEGHPNLAVLDDDETMRCPKCLSPKLQQRGFATTQTGQYPRYQCTSCGGWSRGRYTVNTKQKRKSLLSN